MAATTLVIPPSKSLLPACNPNLMPFHIDYTGPAAVSSYMRVEKLKTESAPVESVVEDAKEEKKAEESVGQDSQDTAVDQVETTTTKSTTTATTTDVVMAESTATTPGSDGATIATSGTLSAAASEETIVVESQASTSTVASSSTLAPVLEDMDRRFVSTFRGRAIHGLTVDLPEGYGGLLLTSVGDDDKKKNETKAKQASGKAKPSAKGKAKVVAEEEPAPRRGRVTRSATAPKQATPIEVDDDEQDEEMVDATAPTDAGASIPADGRPVRELIPTAQFSTFTLWQADRPVDKNRDEYARTLTEWVSLAHEIHCSDF